MPEKVLMGLNESHLWSDQEAQCVGIETIKIFVSHPSPNILLLTFSLNTLLPAQSDRVQKKALCTRLRLDLSYFVSAKADKSPGELDWGKLHISLCFCHQDPVKSCWHGLSMQGCKSWRDSSCEQWRRDVQEGFKSTNYQTNNQPCNKRSIPASHCFLDLPDVLGFFPQYPHLYTDSQNNRDLWRLSSPSLNQNRLT